MSIRYTRVGWQDAPSTDTPIDAANLNHMDNGILAISEELDNELPLLQDAVNNELPLLQDAVNTAVKDAADALEAATLTWDTAPTSGSTNPVTSEGIFKTCIPLWVDMGTISSLPVTKNVSSITADMKCTAYLLGTPSAQTGDWTVTTVEGSVTVSGTILESTTLEIKLEKVTNVS